MNPNEQKLSYPFGDTLPQPGRADNVADGVHWVRMPLPFALDHINVWLLRDELDGRQGWTLVDCGIARDELRAQWQEIFNHVLDGLPILRVIVTHMHPDHVGLAHWLCERWQAPLWMSMTDYVTARLWSMPSGSDRQGSGPSGEAAARHFARHGLQDPDAQQQIRDRHGYYSGLVPDMPRSFRRLMHGDVLSIGGRDWRVITGYGHAPEHVSLSCPALGVLISGDMVLPRISTNISVFDYEPEANPLPLYLNSLKAYDGLDRETLVLPSHGRPFRGLHERVAQQHAHHAERLGEVLAACGEPTSAYEILPVLFHRKLDMHQLGFAMGEAIAHLHALYFDGRLRRHIDAQGVYRFQRV